MNPTAKLKWPKNLGEDMKINPEKISQFQHTEYMKKWFSLSKQTSGVDRESTNTGIQELPKCILNQIAEHVTFRYNRMIK
jgi:hypothetical protein